jgi:hypothetical protein
MGMPHFSDVFSNIFAFLSMVSLLIAPLYLLLRAWQFNKHIQSEKDKVIKAKKALELTYKTKKILAKFDQKKERKNKKTL